ACSADLALFAGHTGGTCRSSDASCGVALSASLSVEARCALRADKAGGTCGTDQGRPLYTGLSDGALWASGTSRASWAGKATCTGALSAGVTHSALRALGACRACFTDRA